jgi:hypothetical protein
LQFEKDNQQNPSASKCSHAGLPFMLGSGNARHIIKKDENEKK